MNRKDDRDQLGVSRLPMPPSDSPLVIDLPDGQKLVLGNMAAGNVIEVATWRGTGRPDSRTSRLMLGMSTVEAVAEQENNESASTSKDKVSGDGSLRSTLRVYLAKASVHLSPPLKRVRSLVRVLQAQRWAGVIAKVVKPKIITAPSTSETSTQGEVKGGSSQEISDWLDSIVHKGKSISPVPLESQAPLLNSAVKKKASPSRSSSKKSGKVKKKVAQKRSAQKPKSRH